MVFGTTKKDSEEKVLSVDIIAEVEKETFNPIVFVSPVDYCSL